MAAFTEAAEEFRRRFARSGLKDVVKLHAVHDVVGDVLFEFRTDDAEQAVVGMLAQVGAAKGFPFFWRRTVLEERADDLAARDVGRAVAGSLDAGGESSGYSSPRTCRGDRRCREGRSRGA